MIVFKVLKRLWNQIRVYGLLVTILGGIDRFTRMLRGRASWRHTRITPQIILGGQPARRHLNKLVVAGVTGVVNMRDEFDYADEIGETNLRYIYLPTVDMTAPRLEDLKKGVEFIKKEVKDDGSVYIHCWQGVGRGATMAAAYFVSEGLSPNEAWEKIRKIRPFIQPTQEQIERLKEFSKWYTTPVPEPERVEQAQEVEVEEIKEVEVDEPVA